MRFFLALLALAMPALGLSVPGTAGPYRVDLTAEPAVLPVGKATLDAFVTDPSGKPVEGAQVRAIAQMPNMAMGEREQAAVPTGAPGHYRFTQSFSMAGGYEARLAISGPLGSGTATIPLETGKTTVSAKGGGPSLLSLWPWLLGLAAIAFVLFRMRRMGQRVDPKSLLNRQVLGALLVLGLVLAGARYAVNNLRLAGSMTPIEAQTMSMDMPPPEGTTPVTLATVESRPLGATARYTGQAVGLDEIVVAARTTGVIVWMPAYVGTPVHKGQVVARLDVSQLGPQVESQRAMVDAARQGVGVAEAESRQSRAMIHQAEAELGQYQGGLEEAQANLAAATADREAARADVSSTQADVRDAQASEVSAQADQRYWTEELKRETALLSAGAVSRDEYERERADAAKADAAARQAGEGVRSAHAKVAAMEARVRKSDSGVVAARRKIDQSRSALMAHHAHVLTAQAEASSADQKVGQAQSGVRQAQAGLAGAVAQASYAEIRAETDGVVTQRVASPGSLVAPGQALLRIARVSPIRVQANVPEADLARLSVGQIVSIAPRDASKPATSARIASISPSVDPTSRTGVVEAILPNTDRAIAPGQFVTMGVPLGGAGPHLVVPSGAVQTTAASGDAVQATDSASFVWVATPQAGQEDRYTVSRRTVTLGPSAGDRVAILSGLKEGDRVVVAGAAGLSDGQAVTASESTSASAKTTQAKPAQAVVAITEAGFVPSTLSLLPGSRTVTFLRKTDATCAKEVVFPDLGIRRDLPLNRAVAIELPQGGAREFHYACGMDMLKGTVVVQ